MNGKRITIYDIAKELGISGSYVSRALNDHPAISKKTADLIKLKAKELNYKQNTHAANLRQGSSKTIGVIVPHINQHFFSDVISGIEEVCFKQGYNLIICQSHESDKQENKAIDTLIHQNVDCIMISISSTTKSGAYLKEIINHGIQLIQFDRCIDEIASCKILNDNEDAAYKAVKLLIKQGYKKIAFLGGPDHVSAFKKRKEGYLKAIEEAGLVIPYNYVKENCLSREDAVSVATQLLSLKAPPDAFLTVSDHQSLGILELAEKLKIKIPDQLGVFGFANEDFAQIVKPHLSSIDQNSQELGKQAAMMYFDMVASKTNQPSAKIKTIKSEIILRESAQRKSLKK